MKGFALIICFATLLLNTACDREPEPDTHNDIEYPATIRLEYETPGNPITLQMTVYFLDETEDSSGVDFQWKWRSDTLWILLDETAADADHSGRHANTLLMDLGALEEGVYPLVFEGKEEAQDTFTFSVEDSLYVLSGEDGEVAQLYSSRAASDTLNRIFTDMLLVEAGWVNSLQEAYTDSLFIDIVNLGAEECTVAEGRYTMLHIDSRWNSEEWGYYLSGAIAKLFTFEGDTLELETLFEGYKSKLEALSIRMGNGFDRYFDCFP